jgi:hypothetical protein
VQTKCLITSLPDASSVIIGIMCADLAVVSANATRIFTALAAVLRRFRADTMRLCPIAPRALFIPIEIPLTITSSLLYHECRHRSVRCQGKVSSGRLQRPNSNQGYPFSLCGRQAACKVADSQQKWSKIFTQGLLMVARGSRTQNLSTLGDRGPSL